ncbi:MAG: hypothetical protein NTW73_03370 [Candidatus Parcubacteria bacterium]|nr:hypothetical protein [Candidatus Parcubacteria bacterium]
MKKILFVFSMIASFVLINNSVLAVAPLPSPNCNIEGIIQSVEFKEAYDDPCLTLPSRCPTDTLVNFPAGYYLKIKISSISYVSGETKYATCEALLPLNTERTFFIYKDDVKTGDSFKIGQKIKGLVYSWFRFVFKSYELDQASITPTITILKPADGDSLLAGSKYTIQWQTQGDTGKLKEYVIYFYNILTKKYNPAVSVPINQTSYNWTVPSAIGNGHYLYVGGIANEGKKYWSAVRKFNIVGSTSTHKECNSSKQCVSVSGVGNKDNKLIKYDLCSGCEAKCGGIGTKSEGWWSSCPNGNNELIKYDFCSKCEAKCENIGTKSEGWYSSCLQDQCITDADCNASTVYNFDLTPATSSKTALVNKYALHI